jgi:hypothetical protein
LKGTVVSVPHSEHVVRVSGRTRGLPRARFALHCLQCLGSFLNCLSWKKVCSPAVKTNSVPQSTHFRALSVNSMAGFPYREIARNRPWLSNGAPVAVPCNRTWCCTRGPGRANKIERYSNYYPQLRVALHFARETRGRRSIAILQLLTVFSISPKDSCCCGHAK